MEKIERLAHLSPRSEHVAGRALEMFRVLRGFAMLDWMLRHPNDLGKRAEVKFEGLVEKSWKLMNEIQDEVENGKQLCGEPDAGRYGDGERLSDDDRGVGGGGEAN